MATHGPKVWLARHGATTWSLAGQHTGRTDLPLLEQGEQDARLLGTRLAGQPFRLVFTSPLQRARRTCELAGFGAQSVVDPDLAEWDYGTCEGKRTAEILQERPGWSLFRDGCPGGESVEAVGQRADRFLSRLRAQLGEQGDALLFAHGHILRVLAARWVGLPPADGRLFLLGTGGLSILGYEHGLDEPVIVLWNEECRPSGS